MRGYELCAQLLHSLVSFNMHTLWYYPGMVGTHLVTTPAAKNAAAADSTITLDTWRNVANLESRCLQLQAHFHCLQEDITTHG